MDIIFYHGHCPDGWAAAYIASKRYPEAKLIPLDHGASFDFTQVEGKDVLMVDFSLKTREENDCIAARAKSFRILDHHKTAQAVLEGAPYATFDMNRSGAGLAWDYLFGEDSLIKLPLHADDENGVPQPTGEFIESETYPRPWYVNYVEARDLWRWESLPNSREVCAYIGTYEFTIAAWDELAQIIPRDILTLGNGAYAQIQHYVREAVKQAQTGIFEGRKTAVLNVPYLNCSEVGNELAKTHEVSLTWFERGDGIIQFSLRSIGDVDVSAIAKKYGGGGHKNASGFQMELEVGREFIDDILGRNLAKIRRLTQQMELMEQNFKAQAELEQIRSSGGCIK